MGGELHSVGEQVDQNLAEPGHVAGDAGRQAEVEAGDKAHALRGGRGGEELGGAADEVCNVERQMLKRKPAGLDLGEVADVVDQRQEDLAARADGPDAFVLRGSSVVSSSRVVLPMTAFIGVRISCVIVARNWLFAFVAASALRRAASRMLGLVQLRDVSALLVCEAAQL